MPSEEVQLSWRLGIAGAEEVKAKLADLHDQFNKGEISIEQYSQGLSKNNSIARNLSNQSALNTRLFLAQHPTINQLTRTMSGLNRVLSAATTAMTAINTAQLLMRNDSSQMIDLQNQMAEATRGYTNAMTDADREKWAAEQARIAAAMEETKRNTDQSFINNIISVATGFGTVATAAATVIPKLVGPGGMSGGLARISGFFARLPFLGVQAGGALSSIAGAAGIAMSAIAGFFLGTELRENNETLLETLSKDWENFLNGQIVLGNDWIGHLTIDIPAAFAAFSTQAQFYIESAKIAVGFAIDAIIKAFTTAGKAVRAAIDSIIGSVKDAIDWIVKLAGVEASPNSNRSRESAKAEAFYKGATPVKKGNAGLSFTADRPIAFMAGEGGVKERVRIEPLGIGGSSGGGTIINNYITVEGSIHAQRDVERVIDEFGIREYRRRGFKRSS